MAEPLPAALKIPEVYRFVNRANQLRSIKPAIAYWCEYHAVNQIVGKSLHTTDDDAFAYTKTLLERLEETKTEHATEDAIVDNDAAQAYVEVFAQQTFDRAERTLRADKVTRQTADTFDAAATFFDLLREWGELDPEILQKIKFAKWNAARILKAIREGRDPNESNPKLADEEDARTLAGESLDPNDPDVQQITSIPQAASVQEVPDAGEPLPSSIPPPLVPEASPLPPSRQPQQPDVQDGYFPPAADQAPASNAPPPLEPPTSTSSQIPPQPSPQIPTKLPSQFSQPSAPPPELSPSLTWATTAPSHGPPPITPDPVLPRQPSVNLGYSGAPAPVQPAPPPAPMPASAFAGTYKDINKAQKHAKFAISALNFDDVPTAVQELRNALAALGTQ